MTRSGIRVTDITKYYGRAHVLKGVSFDAPAGQITGLLGPNGSGKSTTMRVMTGLTPASSGMALFDGVPYAELPNPGFSVGSLLDASAHHPGRTVYETVRQVGILMDASRKRVIEIIEQMGLATVKSRRFGALSLGMRQRVGLAIAFLGTPTFLILDEPMNGLDIESIGWLRNELIRFAHQDGGTVVISSHLLQELQSYVDRVAIISQGTLVLEQSLDDLRGAEGCEVTVDEPRLLLDELHARNISAQEHDGAISVSVSSRELSRLLIELQIPPVELRSGGAFSLEDVYLRATHSDYALGAQK